MKARKTIAERPHADDRKELLLESSLSVVKAAAQFGVGQGGIGGSTFFDADCLGVDRMAGRFEVRL